MARFFQYHAGARVGHMVAAVLPGASQDELDVKSSVSKFSEATMFNPLFSLRGQIMPLRIARSKMTLLAAIVLTTGACGQDDDTRTDTAGAVAQGDTTAVASGTATWSDANIFALLDEANMGDSAHGAIASTKGTSSAVRDYGKQMMRDHHSLRIQGEVLAKRLTVTPAPPADDSLPADMQKATDLLNTTAKGKDFDKAYIDHEVEMHKKVLEIAVQAMSAAQSTELKNMIQKAAPSLQAHLDKAQAIQRNMQ